MFDQVGNPEDRFSHNEAQIKPESQIRHTVILSFNKAVDPKTHTNPKGVQIANIYLGYESKPILLSDL